MPSDFMIRFWGVRGSVPCPGPATQRYGGNTPCVEVRCGDRLIILDAGTGLREFGTLLGEDVIDADILLSHCHYDHVGGIPFFMPLFQPQNRFRLWAGNLLPAFRLKAVVQAMMSEPLFPIGTDAFQADVEFRDFRPGDTLDLGSGIMVRTIALDHPGGATGYRIDYRGRSLAYLTDTEGWRDGQEQALIAFTRNADLIVYDATYTDEEIASKKGWGHSTWREGLKLTDAAGAKTFCLFHHAPEHDDDVMDAIAAEACAVRPGTITAKENAVISL